MNILLIIIVTIAYILFMVTLVIVLRHKNYKPASTDEEVDRSIKLSNSFKTMKGGMKWRV